MSSGTSTTNSGPGPTTPLRSFGVPVPSPGPLAFMEWWPFRSKPDGWPDDGRRSYTNRAQRATGQRSFPDSPGLRFYAAPSPDVSGGPFAAASAGASGAG